MMRRVGHVSVQNLCHFRASVIQIVGNTEFGINDKKWACDGSHRPTMALFVFVWPSGTNLSSFGWSILDPAVPVIHQYPPYHITIIHHHIHHSPSTGAKFP